MNNQPPACDASCWWPPLSANPANQHVAKAADTAAIYCTWSSMSLIDLCLYIFWYLNTPHLLNTVSVQLNSRSNAKTTFECFTQKDKNTRPTLIGFEQTIHPEGGRLVYWGAGSRGWSGAEDRSVIQAERDEEQSEVNWVNTVEVTS